MFLQVWRAFAIRHVIRRAKPEILGSVRAYLVRVRAFAIALLLCVATASVRADVVQLPDGKDPVPLVVVLHGDREKAAPAAARWKAAVAKRGWALLAIDCPRDLGCKDSWWQWDGDPSYVIDKVAALGARIDPKRVYLIGWSGGASYIGWRAKAWSATFAAIVIHGGGMAPSDPGCADRPVYFLVGDKNPLHKLAQQLRAYYEGCHAEVVWDMISGADHNHEEMALSVKKAGAILEWLAARPQAVSSR
jgi:poly(3-hydroxybutyrate) depolymerase